MQFGIIYLRSSVDPSPSESSHAGRMLKLVKQSRLQSNILFATFASKAMGTVKYDFDSSVASFQETSGHARDMFDIALRKPVKFGFLLEELQTISKGAFDMIMCDLHLSLKIVLLNDLTRRSGCLAKRRLHTRQ